MGLYARLFGGGVRNMTSQQAFAFLQANPDAIILDVRQPIETRSGSTPGAVLIPLSDLKHDINLLPQDKTIVTLCRSGHRSPLAARMLKKAGYDAINLTDGVLGWKAAGLPFDATDDVEPH